MRKLINALAVIAGLALIALAIYYWSTPADALPHFLPGYIASRTTPHFKHGVGSFIVGLGLLAYVWFATGKKSKREHGQAN